MSSCLDSSISFYGGVANCNLLITDIYAFAQKIEKGEESALHYLWIYPINLAASLIGITLAPVAALLDLVAAAFFGCFAACSKDSQLNSKRFLYMATLQLTDFPIALFLAIFYPPINAPTKISGSLASCIGLNSNKD